MSPLPEPLHAEPLQHLADWLDDARQQSRLPNANAMVLTTVALQKGEILPSSRVVLCKHIDLENGYLVFYTNYRSRKGTELEQCNNASVVFHWDTMGRQVRVEGLVVKSPAAESDAYFASRSRKSQLAALSSAQSEPISSRAALMAQLTETQQRYSGADTIPRPPHWGGYRLWATAVEVWAEGEHRVHDRARWIRTVATDDDGHFHPGAWSVTRLQP